MRYHVDRAPRERSSRDVFCAFFLLALFGSSYIEYHFPFILESWARCSVCKFTSSITLISLVVLNCRIMGLVHFVAILYIQNRMDRLLRRPIPQIPQLDRASVQTNGLDSLWVLWNEVDSLVTPLDVRSLYVEN